MKPTVKTTPLHTFLRELPADLETPVSIYLRLTGDSPSFLLESVTGGEQVARYSFIGLRPRRAFVLRGDNLETHHPDGQSETTPLPHEQSPLQALRDELAPYHQEAVPHLPRFTGGLVGYLGYEMVRFFEPGIELTPHASLPDAIFLHVDTLIAFDHAFSRLLLITNAPNQAEADARLDQLEASLAAPPRPARPPSPSTPHAPTALRSNMTREAFAAAVQRAQRHIVAGDIFQVVLSQRFERATTAHPFDIYRALRQLNPSPYMFYFDFGYLADDAPPLRLIGASPEMHARLENGLASLRPIAGTRPRGKTSAEDAALESELLADPKERAEHLMLIDLARNDLGRVCQYGSVRVPEQFAIERYSHVMHIVSHTEGRLRPGLDAFDLIQATFPAGTVSGAPKIRAMQLIHKLEVEARGPYAGAIGYFDYHGNADTCIAIRTLVMQGQTVSIQAGAGIVADSDPQREYQETLNKAKALALAVERAEAKTPIHNPTHP